MIAQTLFLISHGQQDFHGIWIYLGFGRDNECVASSSSPAMNLGSADEVYGEFFLREI